MLGAPSITYLCFKCGSKWSPTHVCLDRHLCLLIWEGNEQSNNPPESKNQDMVCHVLDYCALNPVTLHIRRPSNWKESWLVILFFSSLTVGLVTISLHENWWVPWTWRSQQRRSSMSSSTTATNVPLMVSTLVCSWGRWSCVRGWVVENFRTNHMDWNKKIVSFKDKDQLIALQGHHIKDSSHSTAL